MSKKLPSKKKVTSSKPRREKWQCSYLGTETDADFRRLCLKAIKPNEITTWDNPWSRLYTTPTISSTLRCHGERYHIDSLALCLNSTCNQLTDYPITKEDAVRQRQTKDHKCFCKPVPNVTVQPFDHPLRMAPFCETPTNLNYVKLAIECPHISQTNNGYSRKVENGNFYRS